MYKCKCHLFSSQYRHQMLNSTRCNSTITMAISTRRFVPKLVTHKRLLTSRELSPLSFSRPSSKILALQLITRYVDKSNCLNSFFFSIYLNNYLDIMFNSYCLSNTFSSMYSAAVRLTLPFTKTASP